MSKIICSLLLIIYYFNINILTINIKILLQNDNAIGLIF